MTRPFGGIDPGVNGAIAAVSPRGELLWVEDMPTTRTGPAGRNRPSVPGLRRVEALGPFEVVGLERVWARPKEGVSTAFQFGDAYGAVRALFGLRNRVVEFNPAEWQETFGLVGQPKEAALDVASGLWPDAGRFGRKKDTGRADAALIAEHVRRARL